MEITLRKFVSSEKLSQDSTAYNADVYVDGVKAFHAQNDGHGGTDIFTPYGKAGIGLLVAARKWAKTLPPTIHPEFEKPIHTDLDTFICVLVMNTVRTRWERRVCRTKTVIVQRGSQPDTYLQISRPYSEAIKAHVLKEFPGCRIVNEDCNETR